MINPNDRNRRQAGGGARLPREEKPERAPNSKKSRKPRTRQQKILRVLYIILTVLAAIVVALFIGFQLLSAPPSEKDLATPKPQTTTVIDEEGNEVEVEIPGVSAGRKEQFYTFLLVGQDTFGGGNTDTMMLAAYDVPNQKLNVMSLPRDTYVSYNGRKVLLNSVYNRAGAGEDGIEALKEEVGELTGVTPDFYVIVQWEAVGELVDAIDGVWFDVPFDMYYNDLSQDFKIDLKEGEQLLDGEGAMGLLRWRKSSDDSGHSFGGYPTGDIGRIETQQAFMTAVVEKCLQPSVLLPNLLEYLQIFQKNTETDLSISNMAYFIKAAVGKMNMENVNFITMPYQSAGDGAHLLPIASDMVEVVNESFNPYLDDIRLSDLDVVTSVSSSSSGSGQSSRPSTSPKPSETVEPTTEPTTEPITEPTPGPSTEPPVTPGDSTASPSPSQGQSPSPSPSGSQTPSPSVSPSTEPSASPGVSPSTEPSASPSVSPSTEPSASPSVSPSTVPSTDPVPSSGPGMEPTE